MEKGKVRKAVRGALSVLLLALALDYTIPLVSVNKDSQIRGDIPKQEYEHYVTSNKTIGTRAYAVVARQIANRFTKAGLCSDYASATYEAYMNLAQINDRRDLENKIRLAYSTNFGGLKKGHAWIEIYEDGKWNPVETILGNQLKEEGYKAEYKSIPGKRLVYPVSFPLPSLHRALINGSVTIR